LSATNCSQLNALIQRGMDYVDIAWRFSARSVKGWGEETSYFRAKCVNISKTVEDTSKVSLLLMTNREWHMRFRLTPRSMTLNCYKFEFSENFAEFCSFGRQQQLNVGLVSESRACLSHGH